MAAAAKSALAHKAPGVPDKLYTVQVAAEQLDVHRKTVLRFIHEGRLPAARVGKAYRIKGSDLASFAGLQPQAMARAEEPSLTAVVDIPGVSPELAKRWATSVTGALNPRNPERRQPLHAQVIYETERAHLKVVIMGAPGDCARLLGLIDLLTEQLT